MQKNRFLRDGILDEMLEDICVIAKRIPQDDCVIVSRQSFTSLAELYETNKIVLEYLETLIEEAREGTTVENMLDHIIQAAAHIQMGCVTAHNTLQDCIDLTRRIIRSD